MGAQCGRVLPSEPLDGATLLESWPVIVEGDQLVQRPPLAAPALAVFPINATALAVIDLCALSPGGWIGTGEAYARAGVTVPGGPPTSAASA